MNIIRIRKVFHPEELERISKEYVLKPRICSSKKIVENLLWKGDCMKIDAREIKKRTYDYYSCFCGVGVSNFEYGIQFVCTDERSRILKGFGCKYSIYILCKEDACIVSYSPKYQPYFDELTQLTDVKGLIATINQSYPLKAYQLMEFVEECVFDYKDARMLKRDDYALFETFFKKAYPSVSEIGWLKAYFEGKVDKGFFFGYIIVDELVALCDAPDMPYMEGYIQHTGIVTLPEYRRKGYAKLCAALATHHHIQSGIVPQWECVLDNIASIQVSKSIGYKEFAQAFIFEES